MKLLIKYLMEGWIKLYRKIADNPIWTCEPFTRGQAWVDLILLANHEYGYFYVRGHKIEVNRGQVGYSHLKLSERWKWSRTKVKKFLNDLEKEQQIIQQQSKSYSIITIINYEKYQEKSNSKTTEKQQQDTNKNNKEEKRKEYLSKFNEFRNQYPGRKRGNKTEYDNYIKKHKDWLETLPLLLPSLEKQVQIRQAKKINNEFIPEWKNLQTWINQRDWEIEEHPNQEAKKINGITKQTSFDEVFGNVKPN